MDGRAHTSHRSCVVSLFYPAGLGEIGPFEA
jgi:hypothetical protein